MVRVLSLVVFFLMIFLRDDLRAWGEPARCPQSSPAFRLLGGRMRAGDADLSPRVRLGGGFARSGLYPSVGLPPAKAREIPAATRPGLTSLFLVSQQT